MMRKPWIQLKISAYLHSRFPPRTKSYDVNKKPVGVCNCSNYGCSV